METQITDSSAATEAALAELREMFPDLQVDAWTNKLKNQPRAVVKVRGAHFFGDTLEECVTKARTWKESQ